MLRLDLLRDLARESGDGSPARPPAPTLRPVLPVLLALLAIGAVTLYLVKSGETDLKIRGDEIAARTDLPRRTEQLKAEASRLVFMKQSGAIDWLHELETTLFSNSADHEISLAAFTPPGEFVLRGTARTGEALSGLQEALMLFPGMNLRQSRARETGDGRGGGSFLFSGSVDLPEGDPPPAADRVVSAERLAAELAALPKRAADAGIELSPPHAGAVTESGGLRIHAYRLSGTCDSAGFGAVRVFLEGERYRASPFGVWRVTLERRDGRRTFFLDVAAFTP